MSTTETWNNQDNVDYYENVTLQKQHGFSVAGGLDQFSDLQQVKHHIQSAASILEVGACYGRVVDYLQHINYSGKITAIERSKKFFDLLKNRFVQPNVNLIHNDVSQFQTTEKFDLILWMWSGISDFSKQEQPIIIKKLLGLLSEGGILLIDTMDHRIKPLNVDTNDNQRYQLDIQNAVLKGYIPSSNDMAEYSKSLHHELHLQYYRTQNDRDRAFYFFTQLGSSNNHLKNGFYTQSPSL